MVCVQGKASRAVLLFTRHQYSTHYEISRPRFICLFNAATLNEDGAHCTITIVVAYQRFPLTSNLFLAKTFAQPGLF